MPRYRIDYHGIASEGPALGSAGDTLSDLRRQLEEIAQEMDTRDSTMASLQRQLIACARELPELEAELRALEVTLEESAEEYQKAEAMSLALFEEGLLKPSGEGKSAQQGVHGNPWMQPGFEIGPFLKAFPMARIIQAATFPWMLPGLDPFAVSWGETGTPAASPSSPPKRPESGPSPMEAARIAENVYSGKKGQTVEGGWTIVEEPYEKEGLRMAVYGRKNSAGEMEYVIANAGTDPKDPRDWINNAQQVFGESPDVEASLEKAREFVAKHPTAGITFVGHSKGGAEAAINAADNYRDAIVFNPSWANLEANKIKASDYSGTITAYVVEGEILDQVEGPLNRNTYDTVYLPEQHTTETPIDLMNKANAVRNHLMDAVVEGLEEKGES